METGVSYLETVVDVVRAHAGGTMGRTSKNVIELH